MASDQIMEMDVQYVMTRKRKRPAYDSQDDGAFDLLHSETSIDMHEPSLDLIPPIQVTLPSAKDTTANKAVTVDSFIRQITARVPGPRRERQLRTVQLQDATISTGGANIPPTTRPAHTKTCVSNRGRVSSKPIKDRKPMTLTQRLTRAAILSHVETKEILNLPGVSSESSRRPLNFVSFPKFATPPSSPKKKLIKRSAFSRSESSAVMMRNNLAKRQPALERPGYPPIVFVSSHDAKVVDAPGPRSHSGSAVISRPKRLKKPTSDRPGYPPIVFVSSHDTKVADAPGPQSHPGSSAAIGRPKRLKKPTSDRPGYPPIVFVSSHDAKVADAPGPHSHSESSAVISRPKMLKKPTSDRPGYPPIVFVSSHEAEAAYTAMFPRSLKRRRTSERPGYPPLTFVPSHEAEAAKLSSL